MKPEYLVIMCTCKDTTEAKHIAKTLLDKKLAACVNLQANTLSLYNWQGEMAEESEVLMIIKTRAALFDNISQLITHMHSYQAPEILALPVADGNKTYLDWISQVTR